VQTVVLQRKLLHVQKDGRSKDSRTNEGI